jgi:hypothetical protein
MRAMVRYQQIFTEIRAEMSFMDLFNCCGCRDKTETLKFPLDLAWNGYTEHNYMKKHMMFTKFEISEDGFIEAAGSDKDGQGFTMNGKINMGSLRESGHDEFKMQKAYEEDTVYMQCKINA